MEESLIYRKNRLFMVNKDKLPLRLQKQEVISSILVVIFKEFSGAIYNDKYKHMNYEDRIKEINLFAENYIKTL